MSVTVMEIVLLIVSAAGFVISFLIPDSQEKTSGVDEEAAREEIQGLIRQEIETIRGHVEEVVEESVGFTMEKTERSLERLSNEKIMAVNEYSDTVMQEINKSHEEVMFLYDMLNNKHENLKKTVSEASKAAKVMQDTVESIHTMRAIEASGGSAGTAAAVPAAEKPAVVKTVQPERLKAEKKSGEKPAPVRRKRREEPQEEYVEVSEMTEPVNEAPKEQEEQLPAEPKTEVQLGTDAARNSNDRILELHGQGKSNVAIARELGLGVGEVKLVIGLYKNM